MAEFIGGLVIGLMCGGTLGVLIMAALVASARADERLQSQTEDVHG